MLIALWDTVSHTLVESQVQYAVPNSSSVLWLYTAPFGKCPDTTCMQAIGILCCKYCTNRTSSLYRLDVYGKLTQVSMFVSTGRRGGETVVYSGSFFTGWFQREKHLHQPAHDAPRDPTGRGEALRDLDYFYLMRVMTPWYISKSAVICFPSSNYYLSRTLNSKGLK